MRTIHSWKYFIQPSLEKQTKEISLKAQVSDSSINILEQIEEQYPADMGIAPISIEEEIKLTEENKELNNKFFEVLYTIENDPRITLSNQENSVLSTSNTIENNDKIKKQKFRETKKHGKSRKNQKQT